ncbi:MAG TPA: AtpZ/AtpI family protein [Leucothrix mucor]|nr:AtpZ/AtpI family protein [Leucothrix mucor]
MNDSKASNPGLLHIGAGNIFASMIISGLMLGYFVDQWLETTPIFMLIFGVLGFLGGMKRIHALLRYENTGKDDNDSGS